MWLIVILSVVQVRMCGEVSTMRIAAAFFGSEKHDLLQVYCTSQTGAANQPWFHFFPGQGFQLGSAFKSTVPHGISNAIALWSH